MSNPEMVPLLREAHVKQLEQASLIGLQKNWERKKVVAESQPNEGEGRREIKFFDFATKTFSSVMSSEVCNIEQP